MSSHESSTPQVPNASIPKTGFSADRVGALLQKHMAADTPPSRDLGR
jgi:hypothetical protein